MKKFKFLMVPIFVLATIMVILSGCGSKTSSPNKESSQASMQNAPSQNISEKIVSNNDLWYMNGSFNAKSHSGYDAYKFDKNSKTVTIYSVSKFHQSYSAAQKAGDLNKQGTLKYTVAKNSKNQPVFTMKGKLSDIPMSQKVIVKGTVSGKNKATNLSVSGYKVARNLDGDTTQQIFVTPK